MPDSAQSPQTRKSQWQSLMALFEEISELPREDRDAAIRERNLSIDVRTRLERMLNTLDHTVSLLDSPLVDRIRLDGNWFAEEALGREIGGFTLDTLLHAGSIAGVFIASQEQPVERTAVIKLLPPEAPDEYTELFRFEQQTLAKLSHPNIASVYTVDQTDDGLSYLVMEHIDGKTLLEHCDEAGLPVQERLGLFLTICDAIGYCHQRGVLHRDIKSSNILVRDFAGKPTPTIIDFGISSNLDTNISESRDDVLGTPEYMSPEQVLNQSDMDARSDVYSLGMVLFSLLAGRIPFAREQLLRLDRARRLTLIAEFESGEPSAHFTSLRLDERDRLARQRGTDASGLEKGLDSELDAIFRKATHKDRDQRYQSVTELSAEILRYQRHEAVSAHPSSIFYSVRKFIRRHTIASAGALTLVITSGLFVAKLVEQNRAIKNETQAVLEQKRATEQVASMILETLSVANPEAANSRGKATVTQLLDEAFRRVRDTPQLSAGVRASLLIKLGEAYMSIGGSRRAKDVATVIEAQIDEYDTEPRIESLLWLAAMARDSSDFYRQLELAQSAHELCVENDAGGISLVRAKVLIAQASIGTADRETADRNLSQALALFDALDSTDLAVRADVLLTQAEQATVKQEFDKAEEMFLQAKAVLIEHYGPAHASVVRAQIREFQLLKRIKSPRVNSEKASRLRDKAVSIWGADTKNENLMLTYLAALYRDEGKTEKAAQAVEQNIESLARQNAQGGQVYIGNLLMLSQLELKLDERDKALKYSKEAFELVTLSNPSGKTFTPYQKAAVGIYYAWGLAAAGDIEEALVQSNASLAFFDQAGRDELPSNLLQRAYLLGQHEQYDAARTDLDRAEDLLNAKERGDETGQQQARVLRRYTSFLESGKPEHFEQLKSEWASYVKANSGPMAFPLSDIEALVGRRLTH